MGLGKGVGQRGPRIPHPVQDLLAPVQVAQGGVVEAVEQARVHFGGGAHQDPLRVGRASPPGEAVGHRHLGGAAVLAGADALQGQGQGLGLGAQGGLARLRAAVQVAGPEEGHQPRLQALALRVAQFHRALQVLRPAPHVDARQGQRVGGVGDAGGRVVVAGDGQQGRRGQAARRSRRKPLHNRTAPSEARLRSNRSPLMTRAS